MLRTLESRFAIWRDEVRQAAELGWVTLEIRKPRTGRPAKIARIVSNSAAAKLPFYRSWYPPPIPIRHVLFVRTMAMALKHAGGKMGRRIGTHSYTTAYRRVYPSAKSIRGACASASRLLRHPNVIEIRAWMYAKNEGYIPKNELMPESLAGIEDRLDELLGRRLAWKMRWRAN